MNECELKVSLIGPTDRDGFLGNVQQSRRNQSIVERTKEAWFDEVDEAIKKNYIQNMKNRRMFITGYMTADKTKETCKKSRI